MRAHDREKWRTDELKEEKKKSQQNDKSSKTVAITDIDNRVFLETTFTDLGETIFLYSIYVLIDTSVTHPFEQRDLHRYSFIIY